MIRVPLVYFLLSFLVGCSVKGEAIYSLGTIKGWEQSSFSNKKDSLILTFLVLNTDYLEYEERVLLSVNDHARKRGLVGDKPFKIHISIDGECNKCMFSSVASLKINTHELTSTSISVSGYNTEDTGYLVDKFISFKKVRAVSGFRWIEYEFDMEAPHPNNIFELELDFKNVNKSDLLRIEFSPIKKSFYHS